MKKVVILILFSMYLGLWLHYKDKIVWSDYYLSPSMPAPIVEICSGFAKNMAGFSLFIKSAIFIGGPLKNVAEEDYADSLVQNFDVMTQLYPEFIDPYHYSQSFLPHIAPDYARKTNTILGRAILQHPSAIYYPFFQAFNHFTYLDEPLEAARIFNEISFLPNAPIWFRSLSSKLMARGGQLIVGRDMLSVMYKNETNEYVKERYRKELENFADAIIVSDALEMYRREHSKEADSLEQLVPTYLAKLPHLAYGYRLIWEPPLLRLMNPEK